jgi:predicted XRE-type DNA-binding protein
MAKPFKNLVDKMSPAAQTRVKLKTRELIEELPLVELREARELTQTHLAKLLRVKQSSVSKMERRTDMYVSTLGDIIRAMGGELEIRAVFPEGAVRIKQFESIAPSHKTPEIKLARR